jgi:hypothetical protein
MKDGRNRPFVVVSNEVLKYTESPMQAGMPPDRSLHGHAVNYHQTAELQHFSVSFEHTIKYVIVASHL